MNQPIRIPRTERKCFVKLTPDIHTVLSYFAHQHHTTLTNALNSLLGAFFLKYYEIQDSNELVKTVQKAVVPRRKSVIDKLISLALKKKMRQGPLRFDDTNIGPSSETETNLPGQDES
jgi:hypothetical protein